MNSLLLAAVLCGPIQITEVMYDPITLEKYGEYIEIINFSSTSVLLDGWQISDLRSTDDLTGANIILAPGEYALIVGQDLYADSLAQVQFPQGIKLIPVDDILIGNGLGNSGDALFLLDELGDTVSQVDWTGGTEPGYTIEKILLGDCTVPGNWRSALVAGGTPGLPNSVAGLLVDVGIDSVLADESNGQFTGSIRIYLSNKGVLTTDVEVQLDSNYVTTVAALEPGQNRIIYAEPTLPDDWYGYYPIGVTLLAAGDYDMSNNFAERRLQLPLPSEQGLIINEFMNYPLTGNPEWVELYNQSPGTFNLEGFGFADAIDTLVLPFEILESGSYLVLSSLDQFGNWIEQNVLELAEFPTLNNAGDQISIMDISGNQLELVDFNGWDQSDQGRSYERIDPNLSANDPTNWRPSPSQAGHSAGLPNTVSTGTSNGVITLEPNPLPIDGSQDRLTIGYETPFPTINLWIAIYDLAGRELGVIINAGPVPGTGQTFWQTTNLDPLMYKTGQYILVLRARDAGGTGRWDRFERLILLR